MTKYQINIETDGVGAVIRASVLWPENEAPTPYPHRSPISEVLSDIARDITGEERETTEMASPWTMLDYTRENGWRIICTEHGALSSPRLGEDDQENEHDLAILTGWRHEREEHGAPSILPGPVTLIHPDRWAAAVEEIESL